MRKKIGIGIATTLVFLASFFSYQEYKEFSGVSQTTSSEIEGKISLGNSTTATLSGSAVFTGTAEDVTRFSSIHITSTSNVNSAASGISLEFSPDGTNWDRKIIGHIVAKSKHTHKVPVINKFFRVVYTNGTTTQSSFRLQTVYHTTNAIPPISRTGQPQGSVDSVLVRQGTDIDLDYARRHVAGGRAFFFFGFNNAVGTSFEDIWAGSTDIFWLTTSTLVECFSSDAADTSAGLGVRQLEIHGLSETGVDQDEILTMNGTTPVSTSLKYIRVNKVHNENVGTYGGSHKGDITCRQEDDSNILAMMKGEEGNVDTSVQYGLGEAGNGFWSVPLDKVLYITRLQVIPDVGTNKTVDVILYEREGILNTSTAPFDPRRVLWNQAGIDVPIDKVFKSHIKIKNLTDIWFRAKGSATSKIQVFLDFYLLDEDASGA